MTETEVVMTSSAGQTFIMRAISCPTCGPVGEKLVGMRGGDHHRYSAGIETLIVRCLICGLLYPNPFPFPTDPQALYGDPDKYFESHDAAAKIQAGRMLIRECVRRLGNACPRILDVGSGRGELLEAARLEGAEATGLELSLAMIESARNHYNATVQATTIEEFAATSDEKFDVVVLNAVLEHVYDPNAMIAAAAGLARPGAILYVDVPREPHLLSMVGNAWNRLRRSPAVLNLSPTWSPYHVFGFNPRSLQILLSKHGFEVQSVHVWASPQIPRQADRVDRVRAIAGTSVNRVANLTRLASNMTTWAERR